MTGHNFKKKHRGVGDPGNPEEHECVIMHDGDGSSSMTSESEHGSEPRSILPYARSMRQSLDDAFHSTKFHVGVVCSVLATAVVVLAALLVDARMISMPETYSRPLYYITVAIVSIMVLEVTLKALVYGVRFLRHRMELFDCVVVLVTYCLLLTLGKRENSTHGIGLLILLRLWRVSKIVNSMVATVRKEAERRMGKERRARRALEREVVKLREYCLQQECELHMYRVMLEQNNIPQPTVLRPPTAPRTLSVIAEVNELEQGPPSDSSASVADVSSECKPPSYEDVQATDEMNSHARHSPSGSITNETVIQN